ncbi:MAG: hypothetical protein M1813_006069 [Trichoglossum hirsutum]|nr:MAG: hypothetical protein M1813_006069 [Trichoglossum hirsutum]
MKAFVALLYLIIAAGPALALPVADPALDNAQPCDEHDMAKRGLLLRDPGVRQNTVTKREAQPTAEEPEIEVRDPGVRHNAVAKREAGRTGTTHKRSAEPEPMDDCDPEVEIRSPGNRFNGVTKRSPGNRYGGVTKRSPEAEPDRWDGITERSPNRIGGISRKSPEAEAEAEAEAGNRFNNVTK